MEGQRTRTAREVLLAHAARTPSSPLGLSARPEVDPAVFEIVPPIPGRAYWADPTRLVFDPDDPAERSRVAEANELIVNKALTVGGTA